MKNTLLALTLLSICAGSCVAEKEIATPEGGGGETSGGAGGAGGAAPAHIACHRDSGPAPIDADHPCEGELCLDCGPGGLCAFVGTNDSGINWLCCSGDRYDPLKCCAPPMYPECYGGQGGFKQAPGRDCNFAYGPESPYPSEDRAGHTTCHGSEVCGFTGQIWDCCEPDDPRCCQDPCDTSCPLFDPRACVRCSPSGPVQSPNDPACDGGVCHSCGGESACHWIPEYHEYDCCVPDYPGDPFHCCSAPGAADCSN